MPLDTIHGGFQRINISEAQYLAIARTAQSLCIAFIDNRPCIVFNLSGKELIKGSELIDILDLNFVEIDPI